MSVVKKIKYLENYSQGKIEAFARKNEFEIAGDDTFLINDTVLKIKDEEGDVVGVFLMNGYSNSAGSIYRCVGVDQSISEDGKDQY